MTREIKFDCSFGGISFRLRCQGLVKTKSLFYSIGVKNILEKMIVFLFMSVIYPLGWTQSRNHRKSRFCKENKQILQNVNEIFLVTFDSIHDVFIGKHTLLCSTFELQ